MIASAPTDNGIPVYVCLVELGERRLVVLPVVAFHESKYEIQPIGLWEGKLMRLRDMRDLGKFHGTFVRTSAQYDQTVARILNPVQAGSGE